jgi:hypothetical protein
MSFFDELLIQEITNMAYLLKYAENISQRMILFEKRINFYQKDQITHMFYIEEIKLVTQMSPLVSLRHNIDCLEA